MARVRTAVLPAAGFGTRMLPATKAVPKELLPVGRKPAIQWALDEASDAGIERVVVVSSPLKPAIDAYVLAQRDPAVVVDATPPGLRAERPDRHVVLVHQVLARGLGDAVRVARSALGREPFALLLPDEILLGGARLLRVMIEDFERTGQSGVSLLRVARSEIGAYGCAEVAPFAPGDGRLLVTGCIEKPTPAAAPSSFALSGRYVLGPDVADLLDAVSPDERGEVQLTTALDRAASSAHLAGFEVRDEDGRLDVGNWDGWFEANARVFSHAHLIDALEGTAKGAR